MRSNNKNELNSSGNMQTTEVELRGWKTCFYFEKLDNKRSYFFKKKINIHFLCFCFRFFLETK